jgi:hypothetical protein
MYEAFHATILPSIHLVVPVMALRSRTRFNLLCLEEGEFLLDVRATLPIDKVATIYVDLNIAAGICCCSTLLSSFPSFLGEIRTAAVSGLHQPLNAPTCIHASSMQVAAEANWSVAHLHAGVVF